jgi:hypothetical protein
MTKAALGMARHSAPQSDGLRTGAVGELIDTLTTDLKRPALDLLAQRRAWLAELEQMDAWRRDLKRRIHEEGEAAKRERRPANKRQIDHWKAQWSRLGDERIALKNRLGELKAAIKARNVLSNGRVHLHHTDAVAQAFLEVARARLDEDTFAAWLAEAQAQAAGVDRRSAV